MSSFIPEMGGLIVPLHGDDDESGRVNERVWHKTPFSRTVGGKWPKTHSRRGERGKVMGHFSHRGARGLSPLQVRGHCGPSGDAKLQINRITLETAYKVAICPRNRTGSVVRGEARRLPRPFDATATATG